MSWSSFYADALHAPVHDADDGCAAQITLYFQEPSATAAGQRVFDIVINGQTLMSDVDIYALAGGQFTAVSIPLVLYSGSRSNFDISFPTVVRTRPAPPTPQCALQQTAD